MDRASVWKLVSINACDDGVLHAKPPNRFAYVTRLIGIERKWLAFADGAEAAMPGAHVTQNHESRGAFAPALENVRAARFLTDRVQANRNHLIYAV